MIRTVAGTSCIYSAPDSLANPRGLFVSVNFSLFVADSSYNRIQRFDVGQLNATTVAGSGAFGTISLNNPNTVVLDGNGYLFIADTGNHRIIGSGPDGFRCVAGCTNTWGSASNQLLPPASTTITSAFRNSVIATSKYELRQLWQHLGRRPR